MSQMQPVTGRADLHMHTTASDGAAPVDVVLAYIAHNRALDVIAITDHDHIESSLWAVSQQDKYDFEIVPGLEVTSADGHILALWVTELIPKRMSLAETVAAIHEQGGVAIIAHPLEPTIAPHAVWRYSRHPEVLLEAGIDAIEVFNAGAITPGSNRQARALFSQLDVPVVGNSDAHLLHNIGFGYTTFPGRTAADLRAALQLRQTTAEGQTWSTIDYLRFFRSLIQPKRVASSVMNGRSTRPTRP